MPWSSLQRGNQRTIGMSPTLDGTFCPLGLAADFTECVQKDMRPTRAHIFADYICWAVTMCMYS